MGNSARLGRLGPITAADATLLHAVTILIGQSPYTILDTDYGLDVQSNGGAITVTLPALTGGTVPNGRVIEVKDAGYDAAVNNITVARGNGGDKIENVAGSYTISSNGANLILRANTTNNNWEIT